MTGRMAEVMINDVLPGLGRTVLLVDDDRIQRKLAGAQLEAAGFRVAMANSANEALASIENDGLPDAVVSDVVMDDVDGFSLCRLLRNQAGLTHMPVILMSSYFTEGPDRALAKEVGANALIERSPSFQPTIEVLTRSLAEMTSLRPPPPSTTGDLHVRRVSHQLARVEQKYRSLVEAIPEIIWSMGPNGDLQHLSGNVAKTCGFDADELLRGTSGIRWDARVHPDDRARLADALFAVQENDASLDIEIRWMHRDGQWIWLHSRGRRAEDGTIEGVTVDVTGRKFLEDQVYHSHKVAAIGQLTAGIAHDFNNILAIILANTEFLGGRVTGEDREVVDELSSAAQRAVKLTSRLLAFARREADVPLDLDMNGVLTDIDRLLARAVGNKVKLSIERAPGLGKIRAVASEMEQVLVNLCTNARDAMPEGGKLEITTENVTLPSRGRHVAISIRDTGHGMDATTLERLFEPFFTTKPKMRGTGLGLSISYGIVRRYGGEIVVDSKEGEGTTFKIFFPRVP